MFYHVRITRKSNSYEDVVRVDLSDEQLEERFLRPYREGRPVVTGGHTIPTDDIERIQVSRSENPASSFYAQIEAEDRASGVVMVPGLPKDWSAAHKAEDVTDEFITGPPGSGAQAGMAESPETAPADSSVVFVVHGRNADIREAMFNFLRSIGLKPLEWNEAIIATNKPAPFIGEILEAAFSMAQAVVVVMTPDDMACLREEFHGDDEPEYERNPTGQARPNVLFEAGMAIGSHVDRTVLVEIGTLRPFSDVAGRHAVHLNNSPRQRQELATKLRLAGCPVNTDGTDWLTTGEFDLALEEETAPPVANANAVLPEPPAVDRAAEVNSPDFPAFELIRGSLSNAETRFTPDWRIGQSSGDHMRNVEWRFAGPRFQMNWQQAGGARLKDTAIIGAFDLSQPPVEDEDERVDVDEIGLDIRFHWRGVFWHELHRWPLTRKGAAGEAQWDVGREIIPPDVWAEQV